MPNEGGGIDGQTAAAWAMSGGLLLVLANFILTDEGYNTIRSLWNPKVAAQAGKPPLVDLFFQIMFVAVLTLIASAGGRVSELSLAILAGLWLVFLLSSYQKWQDFFLHLRGEGKSPPIPK